MVTVEQIKAEIERRIGELEDTGMGAYDAWARRELQGLHRWIEAQERAEQQAAFESGPGITVTGDTMAKLRDAMEESDADPRTGQVYGDEL